MEARRDKRRNRGLQENLVHHAAAGSIPHEIPSLDGLVQPWHNIVHPEGTAPPQDDSFTIEDESSLAMVDSLLHTFVVRDARAPGAPLVYASAGFENLLGHKSHDVVGKRNNILSEYKLQSSSMVEQLSSAIQSKQVTDIEVTCVKKDGKSILIQIVIVPICDSTDTCFKTLEIVQEVDEKAREKSNEEKPGVRWVELVKHHVHSFMLVTSSFMGPVIQSACTGFEAMFGYTCGECKSSNATMVTTLSASRGSIREFVKLLQHDTPGSAKLLCFRKNGAPFWTRIHMCPLSTDAKETLCIIVDITSTRQKRVGKYILGKVIGHGSFGVVRKGKNTQTDELVAVKTINASKFKSITEIDQLQDEVSVLSNLKHPHIIRLFDAHFVGDTFYVVMELGTHGSLASYIYSQPNGCLTESEAHRIFGQMASALEYCHRRRVAHRDLKPENVLMDEDRNIKIVDFGLAAVSKPFTSSLSMQCGTPEFSAPEIIAGREYQGEQVDVWSMGVMLYEMLTGTLPFHGDSHPELFKAIQRGQYDPLPAPISRSCKDLVRHILKVDPAARCTMEELARHPWLLETKHSGTGEAADDLKADLSDTQGDNDTSAGSLEGLANGSLDPSSSSDEFEKVKQESEGMHDSVRVVIPNSSLDDPIMAAILSRTPLDSTWHSSGNISPTSPTIVLEEQVALSPTRRGSITHCQTDMLSNRGLKTVSSSAKRPASSARSNLPPLSMTGRLETGRVASTTLGKPGRMRSMKSGASGLEKPEEPKNSRTVKATTQASSLPPISAQRRNANQQSKW